jgi:hypothetical protein
MSIFFLYQRFSNELICIRRYHHHCHHVASTFFIDSQVASVLLQVNVRVSVLVCLSQ